MKAYEAALTADATIPPCEPLHALLRDAAEKDVPISSLSLRSVPLGRLGARALAAVLQVDSFITFANLEDTGIGDEGTVAVTEALRTHPTLFRLDLGYNGVGGKGIKAISALLLDSPSLLCLDLSGNNLYSRISLVAPAALAPFASALAPLGKALGSVRCKLQLLHLDHADIEHKGARHAGSCRAAAAQTNPPIPSLLTPPNIVPAQVSRLSSTVCSRTRRSSICGWARTLWRPRRRRCSQG